MAAQAEVEVVTAGCPRVFNPAAAKWYDANILKNYRVVNNKDIIPSVPFAKWGCAHRRRPFQKPCFLLPFALLI
jgi:predicted lipase